jgi:hypothetical protein
MRTTKKILLLAILLCVIKTSGQEVSESFYQPTFKFVNKKIYYGYLLAVYNPSIWSNSNVDYDDDYRDEVDYNGVAKGFTNFRLEFDQGIFTSKDPKKYKSFEALLYYDYKNLNFDHGTNVNKINDLGLEVGFGGILKVFLGVGMYNEGLTYYDSAVKEIRTADLNAFPYYSMKIMMGLFDKSKSSSADSRRFGMNMYGRVKYSGSAYSAADFLNGQSGTFVAANGGFVIKVLSRPKHRVGFAYSIGASLDYYYVEFKNCLKHSIWDVGLLGGVGISW